MTRKDTRAILRDSVKRSEAERKNKGDRNNGDMLK